MSVATCDVAVARGVRRNDSELPIFCKGDLSKVEDLVINYGTLTKAFYDQYSWGNHFYSRSASDYYLLFSSLGESEDAEKIFYDVEPFGGGIVLTHMHIRLGGRFDNFSGDAMCQRTMAIVNAH